MPSRKQIEATARGMIEIMFPVSDTGAKFEGGGPSLRGALWLLLGATVAVGGVVALRVLVSGRLGYAILGWNLMLAWVPLLLALAANRQHRASAGSNWRFLGLSALWLLFFPNAPYIFTDLVHLNTWFRGHYWIDLAMISMTALTGFVLGFLSLFLMQSIVSSRHGWKAGWVFVITVSGLAGLGVYLGRFLRWNSWDAALHPFGISRDVFNLAAHPMAHARHLEFQAAFGMFLLLGYMVLYAMTQLAPSPGAATGIGGPRGLPQRNRDSD